MPLTTSSSAPLRKLPTLRRCAPIPVSHLTICPWLPTSMTTPLRPNCCAHEKSIASQSHEIASQLRTLNVTFRAELTPSPSGAPDAPPHYAGMTSALCAAATAAFGPRVPSQPVPSAVRVHVTNLRRYTLTRPDWASQSLHVVEIVRLKEQLRAAWDVILLEKAVGLAPLPTAPGQPTKVDCRRTLGARYAPPADRVYVVGVPVPLHQQAAVAPDQLRQRHLTPLEALSFTRVQAITGWAGGSLGQPPRATIANLRAIIHQAAATVPYHDLLEYRLFGQLEDAQFTVIVDLINGILSGAPVPQAHSADFINLPTKTPHGPIANSRPLTRQGVEAHGRPPQRPLQARPG